jgi:hypothetical protein
VIAEAERDEVPVHQVLAYAVEVVDGQGLIAGAAGGEVGAAVLAAPAGQDLDEQRDDGPPLGVTLQRPAATSDIHNCPSAPAAQSGA